MKYNRFLILKKLTNKLSTSKIEIPLGYAIIIGFFPILITTISLISPYLYKLLIDNVMIAGQLSMLPKIIISMIIVFLVNIIISAASTYVSVQFNNKVNFAAKKRMFEKLINRDIAEAVTLDVGKVQNIVENDSAIISGFIINQIIGFFSSFLFVVIYLIIMIIINPWLSLVSVLIIPIAIIFGRYTGRKFNGFNNELWQIGSKNNTFLYDTIQKWREIKSYTLENRLIQEYKEILKPEIKVNSKWMKYFALDGIFYEFKNKFAQSLLMYFVGGMFIIWGQISIGSLLMLISYMASLSMNVDSIINSITGFTSNCAVFDRIFELLDTKDEEKQHIELTNYDIEMQKITFAYSDKSPLILKDISYKFVYGKKYLIVGKSGEGKSTLIKLILCMITPNSGKAMIGGIDLRNISQQYLFYKIGTVMQENQFFNLSINDNLKMIAPNVSDIEIKRAAKMACIDDFIESLPNGYDTIIGERGIKLSGGQKQRLAIARMILHNPEIIILDEADRMLDMGFIEDIRFILEKMPETKQGLCFSATISKEIEGLVNKFLKEPIKVSVKVRESSQNVDQSVIRTQDKLETLSELLSKNNFSKVLIFGKTKHGVEKLSKSLRVKGFKVESIHGDKTQSKRQKALSLFKENKINILVATDVAARGLDIDDITHVINYDMPATYEDYIHRIGRTGRCQKKGCAITFS